MQLSWLKTRECWEEATDQFAQVGRSQVIGSCQCQDGADVFDVAGMRRAGKKVVGLAVPLVTYRA